MNQLIPLSPADRERAANLKEANLQDEHSRNMRAIAHEVSGRPNTLLDPSDFLEMSRQATCNAATLRNMARNR